MDLRDLLAGVPIRDASPDLPRDVTGAGYDSHTIQPGQAFVAIHGAAADGHDYTALARQRGASCAISTHPVEGLPYVIVPDTRQALARMAGNFFRHPDRELHLIGVTGTNGKTSVACLTAGMLQTLGIRTGLMGTNGCRIGDTVLPSRRTTPESWEVQDLLRQMADSGCTHAVMEVSSHALALDRVCGLAYTIAAFTNLSRDHLDFHGAMEDYAAAKAALFRQCRAAAVNRDDPWTERILRDCACPVYDYGLHGGHLLAEDMDLSPTGVRFTAREGEVSCPVSVSIPGLFTVYNALAALSMARLSGISLPDAAEALAKVPAVPGRMEPVPAPGLGCRIFIDFAHTPEALAKALEALRPMTPGRIIAVFGCGGCRDKGKRPLMGAAASRYADLTILTSDNPRAEDPLAIIRDILPGITGSHQVVPDRREAIFRALSLARSGDTVLLCGKGHETYQEVDHVKHHMDEREIVAEHHITTMMVTHNMKNALELGNRTLMMDSGRVVLDIGGEERKGLTVEDLLKRFKAGAGRELDNDRILLSE